MDCTNRMNESVAPIMFEQPEPPLVAGWVCTVERLGIWARRMGDELSVWLAHHGLTASEFWVLRACRGGPTDGMGQHELASRLAISPAHVSGLVEQMRARGWLESRRDPADRRRQLWRVTASGGAVWEQIEADLAGSAPDWYASLDITSPRTLETLLARLAMGAPGLSVTPGREAA